MNMYPSRVLAIIGFDIKVSRSGLKGELQNPNKAEAVAQYCNEWWLAVPKGLIKDDDLVPIPWGIMECDDGKLTITKRALLLETKPVTKEFMAAVLRSAGKVDEGTIREAKVQAENNVREYYQQRMESEVETRTKRHRELIEKIAEFEKVTGKSINQYTNIEGLAERIKLAEDIEKLYGRWGTLASVRRQMEAFLKETSNIDIEEEAS